MSFALSVPAAALAVALCAAAARPAPPARPGPRLFAEGVVSTADDESNGSFSPDGAEYYFAKSNPYTTGPRWGILCVTRRRHGRWTPPEVLPFSGRSLDAAPRLSPDGRELYFTSARRAENAARVWRIWVSRRTASGWGEPAVLPAPVNSEESSNLSASVTRGGTIYFASTRGKDGHTHVYRARRDGDGYAEPELLGPEINSAFHETDPFVSPDERLLVFASSGDGLSEDRPETVQGGGVVYPRGDLYASVAEGGRWTAARHLAGGVNSFADESTPSISPDGATLFFTSERSPFSVPAPPGLTAPRIDRLLRATENGHGNVFSVPLGALGLPRGDPPR